jgi:hypothetical protein
VSAALLDFLKAASRDYFLRRQEFGVLKRVASAFLRRNSFRRSTKTGKLRMPEEKRQLCSRTPKKSRPLASSFATGKTCPELVEGCLRYIIKKRK